MMYSWSGREQVKFLDKTKQSFQSFILKLGVKKMLSLLTLYVQVGLSLSHDVSANEFDEDRILH
jgi:hypothetical protein